MMLSNLKYVLLYRYLKNKELNHFYASIFLINFGVALISLFVPIYLYKIGYPIYKVVFFYMLWSIYYLIFLYPGTKIISKIGVKHSILISNLFVILYYLGLNFIDKLSFLFFILPLVNSINTIFYWNSYHALFIMKADKKRRGKEFSFAHIVTLASIAIAPFFGGLIAGETFTLLFSIGSIFVLSSSIPLFMTKESYCPQHFTFKTLFKDSLSKKERKDVASFTGSAIDGIINVTIWPIFLILVLGTYLKTGLLVSLTTALSLAGLYIAGILSDKHDKVKLIKFWNVFHSIAWFARIFANSFTKIFIVDTYKLTTSKFLLVPWDSHVYELADKRDFFRFIVFRHFVYHFSRILVLPIIIFIFYIDFHPFTISFIIAGILSLFYGLIKRK